MKLFFYLQCLFALLFTSCLTPEQVHERKCAKVRLNYELASLKNGCSCQLMDSSSVKETKETIHDTLIYVNIPGEIVHDSISISVSDSITTPVSILKTKYAISRAWIENSRLKHSLEQVKSEIQQVVQGINKETVTLQQKTIRVPYPVVKLVKHSLNMFEKFLLWTGVIAWFSAIAFGIYKFRKLLAFRNRFS